MNQQRHKRYASLAMAAAAGVATIGACGCAPSQDALNRGLGFSKNSEEAKRLSSAMDEASRMLEEYGTVSVSSPLLATAKAAEGEKFALKDGPDEFYQAALKSVQGRVARFDETSEITRTQLEANLDLEAAVAGGVSLSNFINEASGVREKKSLKEQLARDKYNDAINAIQADDPDAAKKRRDAKDQLIKDLPFGEELPKLPASGDGTGGDAMNKPAAKTAAAETPATEQPAEQKPATQKPADDADATARAARDVFAKKAFDELGALFSRPAGGDVQLATRAAINIAAGDAASEFIFGLLSDPTARVKFKDKKLLYGVSMVSVSPGWRAKENFAADVSLQAGFQYRRARPELLRKMLEQLEAKEQKEKKDRAKPGAANAAEVGSTYDSDLLNALRRAMGYETTADIESGELRIGLKDLPTEIRVGPTTRAARITLDVNVPPATGVTPKANAPGGKSDIANLNRYHPWSSSGFPAGQSAGSSVYAAGVPSNSVRLRAADLPLRLQLPDAHPTPLVAAVSPMTDSEILDAAAGARQQKERATEIALTLAALGQKVNSKVFNEFAQKLEDDAATRSATNAVTAYSHSGSLFGFQIGPRLRADAVRRAGQGVTKMELERQSFPVLVIIGMDGDDVGLRFAYEGGKLTAFEPVLTFEQSFRWLPLTEKAADSRSVSTAGWFKPDVEEYRLAHAADLFELRGMLPPSAEQIDARLDGLFEARNLAEQLGAGAVIRTRDDARQMIARIRSFRLVLEALTRPSVASSLLKSADPKARAAFDRALSTLDDRDFASGRDQLTRAEQSLRRLAASDDKEPFEHPFSTGPIWEKATALIDAAIDATYSLSPASGDLAAFVRSRVDMLAYQAYGSSNEQAIPLDLFFDEEAAKPEKTPTLVPLGRQSATVGKTTQFVLAGKNLLKKEDDSEKPKPQATRALLRPVSTGATTQPSDDIHLGKPETVSGEALLVTITGAASGQSLGAEYDLVVTLAGADVTLGRIVFDRPRPPANAAGLDLLRDPSGRVTGLRILPGPASPAQPIAPADVRSWLDALTSERPGGGDHVELNIDGTAGVKVQAEKN